MSTLQLCPSGRECLHDADLGLQAGAAAADEEDDEDNLSDDADVLDALGRDQFQATSVSLKVGPLERS